MLSKCLTLSLDAGDEILFLNEKVRKCTVTGLKNTTVFSMTKRGFEKFRHGLPALAKNIECTFGSKVMKELVVIIVRYSCGVAAGTAAYSLREEPGVQRNLEEEAAPAVFDLSDSEV